MNNSLGKRRFLLTFVLVFSIFILSSFRKHEFHSSLAEIHYNPATKSLEVSLRVFSDDLETALSKENKRTLKVEDNATIDPFIKQYLSRHFVLADTKNAKKSINWVGKEITVDVTWLYFEIPVTEELNGLKINNTLLFESFDDQVNIVNVIYKSQKKTYLFKSDQTTQTIEL
ncbi:DUF6702 family protein [Xanthocytophaga agilis]|uniref:DUF6702 family protein n=1 Tax=Xanthocytophaga agilis TaxID=3048010 RepID=UPI0028D4D65D|nr:DUF6702 family protein [Xanthocytophaga agilis]